MCVVVKSRRTESGNDVWGRRIKAVTPLRLWERCRRDVALLRTPPRTPSVSSLSWLQVWDRNQREGIHLDPHPPNPRDLSHHLGTGSIRGCRRYDTPRGASERRAPENSCTGKQGVPDWVHHLHRHWGHHLLLKVHLPSNSLWQKSTERHFYQVSKVGLSESEALVAPTVWDSQELTTGRGEHFHLESSYQKQCEQGLQHHLPATSHLRI